MLPNERYEKILNQLQSKNAVRVSELSKELGFSESTVRRDIIELDNMGRLKKVFGGAISFKNQVSEKREAPFLKAEIHREEKIKIARYAASFIKDEDFVFIDAGTTTEWMIDFIENRNVIYVTNGVGHAKKLIKKGCTTYIIGGQLKIMTEAIVGAEAVDCIKKYNFTKCFMGANGIDIKRGYTTPDIEESMVKSEVLKRSQKAFVLGDSSKFGTVSSASFGEIGAASIVTNFLGCAAYRESTEILVVKE